MGFNAKVKQGLVDYVKGIHGDNFDDYKKAIDFEIIRQGSRP